MDRWRWSWLLGLAERVTTPVCNLVEPVFGPEGQLIVARYFRAGWAWKKGVCVPSGCWERPGGLPRHPATGPGPAPALRRGEPLHPPPTLSYRPDGTALFFFRSLPGTEAPGYSPAGPPEQRPDQPTRKPVYYPKTAKSAR
jgi:hypothetical protein